MNLFSTITRIYESKGELVTRVYHNLTFGILAFGATALALNKVLDYRTLIRMSWLGFAALLVIPFFISGKINRLSQQEAAALYYTYAASYGVTFAAPLRTYSLNQIVIALGMTATLFSIALYAARNLRITRSDVKLLTIGALALIVISIANLFLRISILELAICSLGMLVMTGFITYEVKIFESATLSTNASSENISKAATLISLSLLNKVINVFIYALRFLSVTSNRRD